MNSATRRQFLQAERAAAASLLARLSPAHFIERISLQSRLESIDQELQELGASQADSIEPASTTVYFDGGPVVSQRAIDASFAASAIAQFQGLVELVGASRRHGPLGRGGAVPGGRDFRLHITDIARGSFGFHFEQLEGRESAEEMRAAVDETTELIDGLRAEEEEFYERIAELEPRVRTALNDFVQVLSRSEATLRMESRTRRLKLTQDELHTASTRLSEGAPSVDDVPRRVKYLGVLGESRRFELQDLETGVVYRGKLAPGLDAKMLAEVAPILMETCTAMLRITTVERPGREPKVTYQLLWLRPERLGEPAP